MAQPDVSSTGKQHNGIIPLGASEADRHLGGEEDKNYDDPALYPLSPGVDTTRREFIDRFVDYDIRGPNDGVRSGPLPGGWGPGRYYPNRQAAYQAMIRAYGLNRVKQIDGWQMGRWGFLIKELKTQPKIAEE